jgi:hypothetical protein
LARHTGRASASAAARLVELLQVFGLESLLNTRFAMPMHNSGSAPVHGAEI